MVVVHKCDICGKIVDEGVDISCRNRVKAEIGRVSIEIILGIDRTWNGGHICNECLAKILRELAYKLETEAESVRNSITLES